MIDVLAVIAIAASIVTTSRILWGMIRNPRTDWRLEVLEALLSGPKLASDLPLPKRKRYVMLARMQDAGLVKYDGGHTRRDGRYIYSIANLGLRMLGEQDR